MVRYTDRSSSTIVPLRGTTTAHGDDDHNIAPSRQQGVGNSNTNTNTVPHHIPTGRSPDTGPTGPVASGVSATGDPAMGTISQIAGTCPGRSLVTKPGEGLSLLLIIYRVV